MPIDHQTSPALSSWGGFHPAFFEPPSTAAVPSSTDYVDNRPRTAYRADVHGSHADFCRHEDFARYRVEVKESVAFLVDFCKRHGMPDACKIADRFETFLNHRFEKSYFDHHVELIDSRGKQSLDSLRDMVGDERIRLDKRKDAIRDLSEGVVMCASGVTANLIAADRALALSAGGIRATLWRMKEDVARNVLQQAVSAEFCDKAGYAGNEIHYVNAVWNYVADSFGLEQIPDGKAPALKTPFLNECLDTLRAAMTADRLACATAEQCLGMFTSEAGARSLPLEGDITPQANEVFGEILDPIRRHYGLDGDTVSLHGFVRLDASGERYDMRRDASLIARELLKVMHDERLLIELPCCHGKWQVRDGAWSALYTFGRDLAWMAGLQGDGRAVDDWGDVADVDLITVPDLLAWCAVRPAGDTLAPTAALCQAIRCSDAEHLADIPDAWLHRQEPLRELLSRSAYEQVQRCLKADFLHFLTELPREDRPELIDDLMGKGDTIRWLAGEWYPNPWKLLGETRDAQRRPRLQRWMAGGNAGAIDAILRVANHHRYLDAGRAADGDQVYAALRGMERVPALNEAMAAGHAEAITAWHGLLRDSAVLGKVKTRLGALLTAASASGTALCVALYEGRAEAIKAYHAILVDPAIAPHIRRALPDLLTAKSAVHAPGLIYALERGKVAAIKAYHAMLTDRAILPHIAPNLPEIVTASFPSGMNGLVQAQLFGRVGAIKAFQALLADPAILPHIKRALPRVVIAPGDPGVSRSMQKGHAAAVDAFRELLVDPALFPYLKDSVPDVVFRSKVKGGTSGLVFAMEKGCADAIQAYHRLLVHPLILPRIARILPDVLAASASTGTPAFAFALQNGNGPAIRAFHAILADPLVLPHIRHALPRLLKANRGDGMPGLALALHKGHADAILACRDLLADAAILPHIRDVLPDLLAARGPHGTRGLVLAKQQSQYEAIAAFRQLLEEPAIAEHISGHLDVLGAVEDRNEQVGRRTDTAIPAKTALPTSSSRPSRRSAIGRAIRRLIPVRLGGIAAPRSRP